MSFKLKPVVSYTTRAKRENETEGVEHYFITPEIAKEKLTTERVLAYTKIGEIEYFATLESLNDSNIYIIDPKGIKYLKENFPDLNIKVIYINTDNDIRLYRAQQRDPIDFEINFKKRNEAENNQFTEFEKQKDWDYLIMNNNDLHSSIINFCCCIINQRLHNKDNILYCVVGRTGSGKDKIVSESIKIFE